MRLQELKDVYNHLVKYRLMEFDFVVSNHSFPWYERILLGHFELFGYRNRVNGVKRLWAALTQTTLAALALKLLSDIFFQRDIFSDDEAAVGALAIVSAVFAGCFVNERGSLYSKWDYLAQLFNQITGIHHFNQEYIHKIGCLAHDSLIMEMWAHKSFQASFNEAVLLAIIVNRQGDKNKIVADIKFIRKHGLDFENAKTLISNLIDASSVCNNQKSLVPNRLLESFTPLKSLSTIQELSVFTWMIAFAFALAICGNSLGQFSGMATVVPILTMLINFSICFKLGLDAEKNDHREQVLSLVDRLYFALIVAFVSGLMLRVSILKILTFLLS